MCSSWRHAAALAALASASASASTSPSVSSSVSSSFSSAAGDVSVVLSSAAGLQWAPQPSLTFGADFAAPRVVGVSTGARRQAVFGFGGCMTDTSAYNAMVFMNGSTRAQLVEAYWGASGLGFSVSRLHINSPDYAFESYNYDNVTDDFSLEHFDASLAYDRQRVLPLAALASAAAAAAGHPPIRFFGSPWSPPAWMKKPCACCHDMICSAAAPCLREDLPGGGGSYREAWAQYIVRWLDAMDAAGVNMWGLTAQNEPEAIQGAFESCAYSPSDMADQIVQHLGPALKRSSRWANLTLMGYDHNKLDSLKWAQALLGNATTRQFVSAFAVHWYDYTSSLGLDNVATIRGLLGPDAVLLNTEACYLEKLVYDWRVGELYAADIIGDLNFGASGWLQWNMVLLTGDRFPQYEGGPNHDGTRTFGDPILFEYNASGTQQLIFLSSYFIIGHVSKYAARPGARLVASAGAGTAASAADYDDVRAYSVGQKASTDFLLAAAFVSADGASASAVVANPTNEDVSFKLLDSDAPGGPRAALASLPAHSIATYTWAL
jgi:glucosylceramidase